MRIKVGKIDRKKWVDDYKAKLCRKTRDNFVKNSILQLDDYILKWHWCDEIGIGRVLR